MPAISGTFSGNVDVQAAVSIADRPNHDLSVAQVRGTQKSADANWNNASITYSAFIDLADGAGTQRGYFVNVHADGDSDFGSFEGTLTPAGQAITCQGTWKITGGTGKYQAASGGGKFSMRMSGKSVETTWEGAYELTASASKAGRGD